MRKVGVFSIAMDAPSSALPANIAALLAPEEKVLWQAQPRPAAFILRGLPNIAYGVTWAVLGAVWYRGSGGIGKDSAFEGWWKLAPLFTLPFVLAGLSFFLAPIKLGARARRTWYFVTDRRVFMAETQKEGGAKLREFPREDVEALQFVKKYGMEAVILSRHAAEYPHLEPRLEEGFFGLGDGVAAMEAIREGRNSDRKHEGDGEHERTIF
jgi:hypothetical protein